LNLDLSILILLAIAAIIFWKLKSVLGQRTGLERPPQNVYEQPTAGAKIIDIKVDKEPPSAPWKKFAAEGSDLEKGLEKIASVQKDFNVTEFLEGAKAAYEMILSDFAKGDKQGLKPLLSNTVATDFFASIDEHFAKGETKLFHLVGIGEAQLVSAQLEGKKASLGVQFASEIIMATLDRNGTVLQGDKTAILKNIETWTFEREMSSRDPNWKLAATSDGPE
jgi:predicted lipid-binding transport protein (Tim44 family)